MTPGQLTSREEAGESGRHLDAGESGRHLAISACARDGLSRHDRGTENSADSLRIGDPERSDRAGERPVGALERYLLDHGGGAGTRPSVGSSVEIPVDPSDLERARIALRRVSADAPVAREIGLAAIALEISLERPLACTREQEQPLTLDLDVADCVLLALALSYAAESGTGDHDAYRQQARWLLYRVDRSTLQSVQVPAVDV